MSFVSSYVKAHLEDGKYTQQLSGSGLPRYRHREGWVDAALHGGAIFAHRCTSVHGEGFTNHFHAHDYFELVVFVRGQIEYLQEDQRIAPERLTVTWRHPGQMHTTRILGEGEYERYVLYFTPDVFFFDGKDTGLLDFLHAQKSGCILPSVQDAHALQALLERAAATLQSDSPFAEQLLLAYLVELLGMLSALSPATANHVQSASRIAAVKQFVDSEYASINSVGDIAARFYYSREHLSRRFRAEFNISLGEYLAKRRVLCSLPLLESGSVTDAALAVGFRSQSAYIAAFKRTVGTLPSLYKKK